MYADIVFDIRDAELKGLDVLPFVVSDESNQVIWKPVVYSHEVDCVWHGQDNEICCVQGRYDDHHVVNMKRWLNENFVDHHVFFDDHEED